MNHRRGLTHRGAIFLSIDACEHAFTFENADTFKLSVFEATTRRLEHSCVRAGASCPRLS